MTFSPDTLYYGDCLEVMSDWPDACVDLIYLDPPFNSNVNHNILFGTDELGIPGVGGGRRRAQMLAFADTWRWDVHAAQRVKHMRDAVAHPAHRAMVGLEAMLGECGMLAYLAYMAERLAAMRRLLKPAGSLWLHCDPTASHYLKAVLDAIFGAANFRNEIIWKRTSAHSNARRCGSVHDVILLYARSERMLWNKTFQEYDQAYIDRYYRYQDGDGRRFLSDNLTAPSQDGPEDHPRRYDWKGIVRVWRHSREKMEQLDREGRIFYTRNGHPRLKRYLDEAKGLALQDLWTDIQALRSWHKERLGYPTQKPLGLSERIIRAGTNKGDLVLDPFCGCGTTVEAAGKLGRRWIGIDISPAAIDIIIERRFEGLPINTRGIPTDMEGAVKMAQEKPFDFEKWAITRIPGLAPNDRQRGDSGIDGRGTLVLEPGETQSQLVLAQVKGGSFQLGQLRDFLHVLERDDAALGVFITLDPVTSRAAQREIAGTGEIAIGVTRYPRAQLWSIADWFAGREPRLPSMNDPWTGRSLAQTRRRLI